MVVWRNIGTKLIGHKIHHHFQLFLHLIDSFNCKRLFILHRLREVVQNYQRLKQLFDILVCSFKNMSQNSRFRLMKIWLVLKVGDQQSNICQTSIRFGFKLFCLYESSTGYTCSFSIYEGKNKNFTKHGLSHDICIDLMQPLLDMAYHLYTDTWLFLLQNFFYQGREISQERYVCHFYQHEWNENFQKETLLLLGKIMFFVLAGMIRNMLYF